MTAALFADRRDAGRRLAERLGRFKDRHPVVIALPRGGVPVGFEIAKALDAPLDLALVRKIGAPYQPELAIAAVVDGEHPETVVNEVIAASLHVPEDYLQDEAARQLQEIDRRRQLYLGDRPRAGVGGHVAIVVDDGIATGATVRAALRAIRHGKPERLVLAVAVAPRDTLDRLRPEVDEIVCLAMPEPFYAIGPFYGDFTQIDDDQVIALLKQTRQPPRIAAEAG